MKEKRRADSLAAAAALLVLARAVLPGFADSLVSGAALLGTALAMPDAALSAAARRYLPQDAASPSGSSSETVFVPPSSSQAASSAASASGELPQSVSGSAAAPEIPEACRGRLEEVNLTGEDTLSFLPFGSAWIRNYTTLSREEISAILETPATLTAPKADSPYVLIYHTHATESYEAWDAGFFDTRGTWRSEDNAENVTAVGGTLCRALQAAGTAAVQDLTQHDNPSYGGAYQRSAVTIRSYQEKYPALGVILDIHRDAIQRSDDSLEKTVAVIGGRKAAQLMVIAPCDPTGSLGIPHWKNSLRLAAGLTDAIERAYPGLTRPVYFISRAYNYALCPGALLLEFGSSGNTLEEAQYTAELIAPVMAEYFASLSAA